MTFNADERAVLRQLTTDVATVVQLATACWPDDVCLGDREPSVKGSTDKHRGRGNTITGYRRCLNALRRLVRYGYAEKTGRGTYAVTERGRSWAEARA